MKFLNWAFILFVLAVFGASACSLSTSGWLPSEKEVPKLPWKDYAGVSNDYDRVVAGETTLTELKELGFDLSKVSDSMEWDTFTTRNFILPPNMKIEDLPMELQMCTRGGCRAQEFPVKKLAKNGIGNFFKEKLGYLKERNVIGWSHWTIFIYRIDDSVIIFKDRKPQPFIDRVETKKDPLGPFEWLFNTGRMAGRAF